MALSDKKYTRLYSTTGSDADKIDSSKEAEFRSKFETNEYLQDNVQLDILSPLIYQIQKMQEELDYLRTEISSNKDNKTVIGSNTTLSFGDLTATTVKGVTRYTIDMTATRNFGGKVGNQTKSITLTLQ
tara:strand:- start:98 stop:484 length:387 start_codon:yes stop_codon:yes gene_type:complete